MSVARLSISLPQSLYQVFLSMVKRNKSSKSQMFAKLVKKEDRQEMLKKLSAQYNELAKDPEYIKETQEFISLASASYARNVLEPQSQKR